MNIRGKIIDFSTPMVMGVLNITHDSFYDGGRYLTAPEWQLQVGRMVEEGAAFIDIGAVSTRPGARDIPAALEKEKILKALSVIRPAFPDILISVDTWRSSVAEAALENGADMINDISGGTYDERIFEIIAAHHAPIVLMHIQGKPGDMQENPVYQDVVLEVKHFLMAQAEKAMSAGIREVIIDPGFGFGKTLEHNYILLSQLNTFKSLGYPLMAGVSRKSMINKVLGTRPETSLNGTTIANTIALMNGADILRVHDVKEAIQAIRIVNQTLHVSGFMHKEE